MRGFTLIEVLVALAIVAIGMSALMSAMSSAADTNIYLRDKMFAEWIALNRVEELRLQFRRPSKGKANGEVEYAGRRWRYEQELLETEIPGLLRIEVKVRPADISASNKGSWYTTTSGLIGDAILPPRGDVSDFARPSAPPNPGGNPRDPNRPGEPPPQEPTPDAGEPPTPIPEVPSDPPAE